jgi:hypothetical protein
MRMASISVLFLQLFMLRNSSLSVVSSRKGRSWIFLPSFYRALPMDTPEISLGM